MPNGTQYENEFERRLWDDGWATFRVAGSDTVDHASCDIIAVKGDRVVAIEVKSLNKKTFPYNVSKDSDQLDIIRRRGDIETYFAVRRKGVTRAKWVIYPGTSTMLVDDENVWHFPYKVF